MDGPNVLQSVMDVMHVVSNAFQMHVRTITCNVSGTHCACKIHCLQHISHILYMVSNTCKIHCLQYPISIYFNYLVREIQHQDRFYGPDHPTGPAASRFGQAMTEWQAQLTQYFGFSTTAYWRNTHRAAERIRARVSFLPYHRVERIVVTLLHGYKIHYCLWHIM